MIDGVAKKAEVLIGLVRTLGVFEDEEILVSVALVLIAIGDDPEREPVMNDVIWAMDFINRMEEFGKEIVNK